jgi:hypothetical protein
LCRLIAVLDEPCRERPSIADGGKAEAPPRGIGAGERARRVLPVDLDDRAHAAEAEALGEQRSGTDEGQLAQAVALGSA